MCLSFVTIAIEFAAEEWTRPPDPPFPRPGIRLVESRTDSVQTFTLVHGMQTVRTLTVDETDELLRLLGQIVVRAPWEGLAGLDGCNYCLILKGRMSDVTFTWWADVPKGWESVGAVADHVIGLIKQAGLSPYG